MLKPLKSILFATNLHEYNKSAFDVALSLATRYEAKLVLLHVLEKLPESVEAKIQWMIKDEQREHIKAAKVEDARKKLIGKNVSSSIIQASLLDYCKKRGSDDNSCRNPIKEVVVIEGDVIEEILLSVEKYDCGMIVLAAHEGLFNKTAVSRVIRRVLKGSTVPVLTVPYTS